MRMHPFEQLPHPGKEKGTHVNMCVTLTPAPNCSDADNAAKCHFVNPFLVPFIPHAS